jgi:hypothetical protein
MAKKTLTIDYTKLPFEVHYNRLDCHRYEFMAENGQHVESYKDCTVLRKVYLRSYGLTFACNDPSGGKLIYILGGRLDEFIPDWLELVDEEDGDANSQELYKFRIDGARLELLNEIYYEEDEDGDELYEPVGAGADFYLAEGYKPAYLVLDADNSRLVVDCEGFVLADDDSRMGKAPVVSFTEDDLDETECTCIDYGDIDVILAKMYEGPIMVYDEDSD